MGAAVIISGHGLRVKGAESHPAGVLFSGGYDAKQNAIYLAGVMGHPRGVTRAGGNPSSEYVSGLRVLIVESGDIYWATDSMSLPRGLTELESTIVQSAIEEYFAGKIVRRVEKLEDAKKYLTQNSHHAGS